ncbi:hypothetical protein [Photobacterium piscicola]|uniref:Uncharacterized protein n=1 Tax=Photobacterium piscicola TaxID=1378299 RepID=A0ABU6LJZ3_9GAMM|nr:hypothetical protein [Photobacterium piscicola]
MSSTPTKWDNQIGNQVNNLTPQDCYRIVKAYEAGITIESIAACYDTATIQQIINAYWDLKIEVSNG